VGLNLTGKRGRLSGRTGNFQMGRRSRRAPCCLRQRATTPSSSRSASADIAHLCARRRRDSDRRRVVVGGRFLQDGERPRVSELGSGRVAAGATGPGDVRGTRHHPLSRPRFLHPDLRERGFRAWRFARTKFAGSWVSEKPLEAATRFPWDTLF
jgi:hypothetical protein